MTYVTIIVFYAGFFLVGAFAGRHYAGERTTNDLLLAGKRLPLWLGVFTLIATWVGGGYINGTAEAVYDPQAGLIWTQAPWCFALSLMLGGLIFARPMRRYGFTTMLDLFERRYGPRVAGVLYIPALLGEVFWTAAILAALGGAFGTILGLETTSAILISAAVAVVYTVIGGLWSVALTDGLQLVCIAVGLGVALPFAVQQGGGWGSVWQSYQIAHPDSARLLPTLEMLRQPSGCRWIDTALLLILGGIPWQVYFQRVLACRDDRTAVGLSLLAGVGCLVLALPSVVIGMVGSTVDWTPFLGETPEPAMILPYVLRYLTPPLIGTLGLCAIAAAVMSSVDSSILSASSMFAWNIFRPLRRESTDSQIRRVMQGAIVAIGLCGAVLAISVGSVYTLWYLSADLVYVILFPQLVVGLFDRRANAWGALCGAAVGTLMRAWEGQGSLVNPAALTDSVLLPPRTAAMLVSLCTIVIVSRLTAPWNPPRALTD